MHQEDLKRGDDIYENYIIKPGRDITDRNTSRIQSSDLTGSDGAKISSRAAVLSLVLLCVLLLIAVIVMSVTFTQERQQLLTIIISHTDERQQLLANIIQFNQEKNELLKFIQAGWIYYQFSLYYVSNETKNWTESRRYCTERGADLVIINNYDEQDFVNKMSNGSEIWIGLTDSDEEGRWKWVDNSTLTSGFWRPEEPDGGITENCTISRSTGWCDFPCTFSFNWICERKNLKLLYESLA